jgi:hypothetical protein
MQEYQRNDERERQRLEEAKMEYAKEKEQAKIDYKRRLAEAKHILGEAQRAYTRSHSRYRAIVKYHENK